MRIMLDTNVLISAILFRSENLSRLIEKVVEGMYQIISGTSDWSWMSSYWDDPVDNLFIRLGSRMYNMEHFDN